MMAPVLTVSTSRRWFKSAAFEAWLLGALRMAGKAIRPPSNSFRKHPVNMTFPASWTCSAAG